MVSKYTTSIWTDNERTRHVIWEAYEAFCEHYENYIMYKSRGVNHQISKLGLLRYANRLYIELKHLMTIFVGEKKIKEEDVRKFHTLMQSKKVLMDNDFIFIREVVADFMFFSGIKNIVMQKDSRSNYDKIRSKFGVQDGL